jgi:ribosomal protein L7Ae-like RNA K-turn-binding protein
MEKDEDATLASLNDCNKIIEPLIKKQKGRIFNTGGDSIFAEFPSAVAAVNTAVEFQKQIRARNDKDSIEVKLEYRIGINMGDVVKQGDTNLMGDGVNVAARLEALAQSGGITISKNVYDLVENKTKYEFNDLGIQKVKQNQFHAYDLLLDPTQKRKLKTQSSKTKIIAMIGGTITAVFIGLFFSAVFDAKKEINVQNLENSIPENPSIIVMPFENISNNSEYKYLSKSIVENIISVINGSPQLVVLSSETSLNQINQNLNIQEIAEKNNVRYVLTGSYQVLGKKSGLLHSLMTLLRKILFGQENLIMKLIICLKS